MKKGGGGAKQKVADYLMSIHFGVCLGPVDALTGIFIGEKPAWGGEVPGNTTLHINEKKLFGGPEKEGGVAGRVEVLLGGPDQEIPTLLASKVDGNRTSETMPAYRGVMSLFFYGDKDDNGFLWGTNNPYVKPTWARVRRAAVGLTPSIALVPRGDEVESGSGGGPQEFDSEVSTPLDATNPGFFTNQFAIDWTRGVAYVPSSDSSDPAERFLRRINLSTMTEDLRIASSDSLSQSPDTTLWGGGHVIVVMPDSSIIQGCGLGNSSPIVRVDADTLEETARFGSFGSGLGMTPTRFSSIQKAAAVTAGDKHFLLCADQFNSVGLLGPMPDLTYVWDTDTAMGGLPHSRIKGLTAGANGQAWFVGGPSHAVPSSDPLVVYWLRIDPLANYDGNQTTGVIVTQVASLTPGDLIPGETELANGGAIVYDPLDGALIMYAEAASHNSIYWIKIGAEGVIWRAKIDTTRTVTQTVNTFSQSRLGLGTFGYVISDEPFLIDTVTGEVLYALEPEFEITKGSLPGVGAYDSLTGSFYAGASHDGGHPLGRWQFEGAFDIDPGIDANPAHIIYECMTNTDYGLGERPESIDIASFEAAAQLFYRERFGLSLIWTRQTEIQNFIGEILDHVSATLFIHPRTGLWTLKPIRDDYDPDTLRTLTPENCRLTRFQTKAWGETINEIVVTWTNPENEQDETVTLHDLANIAVQGGIVSDSRNYYGIRYRALAMRVAARDLRQAAAPLATAEAEADRSFWDVVPGDVLKLTWPEYGINEMVMRVMKVSYGRPGSPKITLDLAEDIFALEPGAYETPPESEWQDPSEIPGVVEYSHLFTLPYSLLEALLGPTEAEAIEYPEVYAGVLASQDSRDTRSIELLAETPSLSGKLSYRTVGTLSLAGRSTLAAGLVAEVESTGVTFGPVVGRTFPADSVIVLIGDGTDAETELALITDGDDASGWTLVRGVLDTIPRNWPADTPVWFMDENTTFYDLTPRSAAQTVKYKLLTNTSLGQLDEALAPVEEVTLDERPHRPIRPAAVTVAGVMFGEAEIESDVDPVEITWANRNRTQEPTPLLAWDDGNVLPEDGQTTTVAIFDTDDQLVAEHDELSGTSFNLPIASFGTLPVAWVQVSAERDGLESLQAMRVLVRIKDRIGYGNNYGNYYGGNF